jgi:hypothetical protein
VRGIGRGGKHSGYSSWSLQTVSQHLSGEQDLRPAPYLSIAIVWLVSSDCLARVNAR